MGKVLEWLACRGALLASFAFGILTGALLRYPTGWVLPDSSANIVGAAAGAMLSVGGAFVVLHKQQASANRDRQNAQIEAFKHYADILVEYLLSVRHFLWEYPGIGYDDRLTYALRLKGELALAQGRVRTFEAYRFELGLEGTRVFNTTSDRFSAMWRCVELLANVIPHVSQSEESRMECHRQYRHLTALHNAMVREIARASGDDGYLDLLAPEAVK